MFPFYQFNRFQFVMTDISLTFLNIRVVLFTKKKKKKKKNRSSSKLNMITYQVTEATRTKIVNCFTLVSPKKTALKSRDRKRGPTA